MVDEQQTGSQLQRECLIYRDISHQDLKNLLAALSRSYTFTAPLPSVEESQPENKLDPNFFASSFAGSRDFFYYADPFLVEREENTPRSVLSRHDVIDLLESILKIIEEQKLGNTDAIAGYVEGQDLISRLKKGLDDKKDLLKRDIDLMYSIVDILEHSEAQVEKPSEVEIGIPQRLKELIDRPFDLKESWPIVKQLAKDAALTPIGAKSIATSIENEPVSLQVIQFRFFINDWLKKLYSDEFKAIAVAKRVVFPEMELFLATNKFFAFIDREEWNEQDVPVTSFILKELSPLVDDFFKAKEFVPPSYATDSTESTESESNVTKEKTKEELDDLLQRFSNAHASYVQETERLTTILLPQFFAMHSIQKDIVELQNIDPGSFALVEREFRAELQNVLRSLSPEEFKLLSQRGGSLEFRLIVLRRLYGKLSTNPRFVGSLLQYKEKYVEYLTERVNSGKESPSVLDAFDRRVNLDDDAFEKKLVEETKKDQSRTGVSWDGSAQTLADFSVLQATTQQDLRRFIDLLADGQEVKYDVLFRNLDVLIAERWSPEQIADLTPDQAYAVLGFDLPSNIKNDPTRASIFFRLCSEFLYVRRQRLADHYELDAISRDSGKPGDLASLKEAQELAEKYKDDGGGESVIVARASDSARVREYGEYGHRRADAISAIHKDTSEKRKAEIEQRKLDLEAEYRSATTIAAKRAMLLRLGVLTPEIDEVSQTEDAQVNLLNDRFTSAISDDYKDGIESLDSMSFYEDQDQGAVQNTLKGTPVTSRYGRPGARSLMKGSVNVRGKYGKAKERIKEARKKLKRTKDTAVKSGKAVLQIVRSKDNLQKGLFAVALASLIDTISLMTQNGLSTLMAIGGGAIGGLAGLGLFPGNFFAGGIGFLGGAWGGARAGAWLTDQIPFLKDVFGFARLQLPGASGATSLIPAVTATQAPAAAAATATPSNALTLTAPGGANVIPAAAMITTMAATIMTAVASLSGALSPPPITTLNSSGLESQYVTIRKITTGDTTYQGSVPSQLTYQIYIQAKENYQLELVNFQDVFTIKTNTEKNSEIPPELNCNSQMNMDTVRTKVFSAADGEVLLGECTVLLTQSYHDSSINNEITIQFKVTQDGQELTNNAPDPACGENETTFCAVSALNICLGECPAAQQGCWPTNGTLTQPPYGDFSHDAVDAIDIGARAGTPVYATFDGQAWAFDTYASEPSQQGHVFRSRDGSISRIYGKHIVLVTQQGFVLLYGHLSGHAATMQLGQPVQVTAGDLVGYVGNSGSTASFPMGNHLHYEYRIPAGGTWHSKVPGAPNDPLSAILPGNAPGEPFVYSRGMQVTSCYSESGTP